MTHKLKTLPPYFQSVWDRTKTFEIRKNDRDFLVGDYLHLYEYYDPGYSGRSVLCEVTYITTYEQKPGFVVMSIKFKLRQFEDIK